MKKILYLFVAFMAFGSGSFAATIARSVTATSGSLTMTKTTNEYLSSPPTYELITLVWTSDASGNATVTVPNVIGEIRRIVTNPSDGATSPTADYDVTLKDADAVDVMVGQGANLSQSANKSFYGVTTDAISSQYIPITVYGDLSLAVTNAGNAKKGTIKLYLRK